MPTLELLKESILDQEAHAWGCALSMVVYSAWLCTQHLMFHMHGVVHAASYLVSKLGHDQLILNFSILIFSSNLQTLAHHPKLHSRGAKLSCLLAEREPNVRGMALLDPVDNTSMTPAGDLRPWCLSS